MITLKRILQNLIQPSTLAILFILLLYLWLSTTASFMVDDACQAARYPLNLWDDLIAWEATWSVRPVSWFLMPIAIHIFEAKIFLFFVLNSSLYLSAAYLFSKSLSLDSNRFTKLFIFIGISLPIFSDSVILSPVNQLSATLSIVFFAIGLFIQKRTLAKRYSISALLFYLLSFLSYEISLGLVLLIPLATLGASKKALKSFQLLHSLLPVATGLIFTLIWQKALVPFLFGSSNTRLSFPDPFGLLEYLNVWLIEVPKKVFLEQRILGVLSLVCILLMFAFQKPKGNGFREAYWWPYLLTLAIAPSVLYILSGYHATSDGYLNRGLSTAWIVLVVLAAHMLNPLPYKRMLLIVPCLLALVLFQDRIGDAISVSNERNEIADSIALSISEIDSTSLHNAKQPTLILADVPCTSWDSRNKLTVFCTSWDLSSELALRGKPGIDVLPLGARLQFPEYLSKITSPNANLSIWYLHSKDSIGVTKAEQVSNEHAIAILGRFENIKSYPEKRFVKKEIRCALENSDVGQRIFNKLGLTFRTAC